MTREDVEKVAAKLEADWRACGLLEKLDYYWDVTDGFVIFLEDGHLVVKDLPSDANA